MIVGDVFLDTLDQLCFFSNWDQCLSLTKDPKLAKSIHNKFALIKDGRVLFDHEGQMIHKEKKTDLLYLQRVFMIAKHKWEMECPQIPFPNIIIKNSDKFLSGALLEFAKTPDKQYYPEILLHADLVSSQDTSRILWVIGHELGHLYYRSKSMKSKVNISFLPKSISGLFFLAFSLNLLYCLPVVYQSSPLLALFPSCVFLYFFLQSLFTLPERIQRYSEEYFCDSFSLLINNNPNRKILKFSIINGPNHPSNSCRVRNISKNKYKSISHLEKHFSTQGMKINILESFFVF